MSFINSDVVTKSISGAYAASSGKLYARKTAIESSFLEEHHRDMRKSVHQGLNHYHGDRVTGAFAEDYIQSPMSSADG